MLSEFSKNLNNSTGFELICIYTTSILKEFISTVYAARNKNSAAQHLANAIDYIRSNYSQSLKLETVASNIYVSSFYLSHLFRSELDTTFLNYVTEVRIDAAKSMLMHTSEKVSVIADKCGYSDANYFSKQFKRVVGISPGKYR